MPFSKIFWRNFWRNPWWNSWKIGKFSSGEALLCERALQPTSLLTLLFVERLLLFAWNSQFWIAKDDVSVLNRGTSRIIKSPFFSLFRQSQQWPAIKISFHMGDFLTQSFRRIEQRFQRLDDRFFMFYLWNVVLFLFWYPDPKQQENNSWIGLPNTYMNPLLTGKVGCHSQTAIATIGGVLQCYLEFIQDFFQEVPSEDSTLDVFCGLL